MVLFAHLWLSFSFLSWWEQVWPKLHSVTSYVSGLDTYSVTKKKAKCKSIQETFEMNSNPGVVTRQVPQMCKCIHRSKMYICSLLLPSQRAVCWQGLSILICLTDKPLSRSKSINASHRCVAVTNNGSVCKYILLLVFLAVTTQLHTASMHNTRTLKLKQLNGMKSSLIFNNNNNKILIIIIFF